MNQAILFSDNERYNAALKQIEFKAQCEGALITCIISLKHLFQMNNVVDTHQHDDQEAILTLFDAVRFDIEEIAEEMIQNQHFHQDGNIYLTVL